MKEILELTAYELHEAYINGKLTVPEVVQEYLNNIKEKEW